MNCENASPLLYRFADGLLLPDDHKNVARHLTDCASCRARVNHIEDLDRLASSVENEQPSADLRKRLLSDYRATFGAQRAPKPATPKTQPIMRLAASIAIVVLAGVTGFFAGRQSPETTPTESPSPIAASGDIFPIRLVESYTVRAPDGQITEGAQVKIIQ